MEVLPQKVNYKINLNITADITCGKSTYFLYNPSDLKLFNQNLENLQKVHSSTGGMNASSICKACSKVITTCDSK